VRLVLPVLLVKLVHKDRQVQPVQPAPLVRLVPPVLLVLLVLLVKLVHKDRQVQPVQLVRLAHKVP
jgi:hypothetical protein